ncbi:Fpg/Nei family DNA glycosylase [Thiohalocapsa marina]|uniref:DNA-(apurinic or apyrimidinic site) lyase n=1 Tax=Thiohalocapsa marina TaxID=424902 RepID=A0A5M8FHW0_9GAMM|nr:DNA-formamidopyrimidine glycosylase family protein [Thiohalocapsa marina]KAA6184327.1 Fpg/Nei family DNA glycosylase [Thiohalocapsa marina]
MPEGDTIHKLAVYLDAELNGKEVTGVRLQPRFGPSCGPRRVSGVGSEGKHLFVTFDDGVELRSHLGMYGSWHRYRPSQPWKRPARQASIVIRTGQADYVCFNAKEVQWLRRQGFERADLGNRLGPDLIRDPFDPDALASRIAALLSPDAAIVDVLLDQRIAAGIGNVYKSEVLFLQGHSPHLRLKELTAEQVTALYRCAAEHLGNNLGGGPRTTRRTLDGRGRLWVYGRFDRPCLRCGTPIRRAYLGTHRRSTYWCPGCQSASAMR